MTAWHAVVSAPTALLRAVLAFFRRRLAPKTGGIPPAATDGQEPNSEQELRLGLATSLLSKVHDGLSGHSEEIDTFARALAPAGSSLPRGSWTRMQAANLSLEELVESTVDRLRRACGSLFSAEESHLEAYSEQTSAFGKRLDDIPSELVLTHVVTELLGMMQGLRQANEAARNEMAQAQKKLCQLAARATAAEREARIDPLTKLLNRRAFDEVHAECHDASQDRAYCLVMVDADRFKDVNDRYGHAAGDAVLSLIGRVIRENCRAADHLARWGGEEFAILMPEVDEQMALGIAERLRRKIETTVLHFGEHHIKFTVSCGIVRSRLGKTQEQILQEADIALYAAKEQGRNRCLAYGDGFRMFPAGADAIAV